MTSQKHTEQITMHRLNSDAFKDLLLPSLIKTDKQTAAAYQKMMQRGATHDETLTAFAQAFTACWYGNKILTEDYLDPWEAFAALANGETIQELFPWFDEDKIFNKGPTLFEQWAKERLGVKVPSITEH